MGPRPERSNIFYYSEQIIDSDSSLRWDSDNSITKNRMAHSPRFAEWLNYLSVRRAEEENYEDWKRLFSERHEDDKNNIVRQIASSSGWNVKISKTTVWYIYRPYINGKRVDGIKYKVKFEYVPFLRRWCLRLAWSCLPEGIDTTGKSTARLKYGIDNPTCRRISNYLVVLRKQIDVYLIRRQYVIEFEEIISTYYPDLDVFFDEKLVKVSFEFLARPEHVWIPGHPKISRKDQIIVHLVLDDNFVGIPGSTNFTYIVKSGLNLVTRRKLSKALKSRLDVFFQLPLKEAFAEFMGDDLSSESSE